MNLNNRNRMLRVSCYACFIAVLMHGHVAQAELNFPAFEPLERGVLIYDASTGDLSLDYPDVAPPGLGYELLTITSDGGLFNVANREPPEFIMPPWGEFRDVRIRVGQDSGQPLLRDLHFESILPPSLTGEFVASDLSFTGSCPADSCFPSVGGLVVVPEPATNHWISILLAWSIRRNAKTNSRTL